MRLKATLILLCAVTLAFFVFEFAAKQSSNRLIGKRVYPVNEEEKENRQEEVLARMKQEVLMTKDPAVGYVPNERLIEAEKEAIHINAANSQSNNPQALLTWTERGPNNMGGRARAILIDKNDATGNTVLIGSVSGGLWRTTNFKAATPTWSQIASVSANLAITTMAQDPSSLNTMYAGTGEGYFNIDAVRGLGIYKSTNAGLTWALLPSTTTGGINVNDFNFVQKILVYTNGDVYASGISAINCNRGGILKSTNGGTSWTRVIGQLNPPMLSCADAQDFSGYDIEMSTGGDLYASVQDIFVADTTIGKVYRSLAGVNVGNVGTWTNVTPPPPVATGSFWQRIELACSPLNNNTVYALLQGTGNAVGGIRVTTDQGANWTNIDNATLWCDQGVSSSTDFSRNQAWYDLTIAVKPDDDQTVFVGGVDLMKTTNGGTSWAQATQWAAGCGVLPNIHADNHNIVYFPGTTTEFIVVNDGGIYYTNNNATSFTNKDPGFNTIQYYANAIHPTVGSNYMLAGAQDNGSHKFTAAGLGPVTSPTGGDGGFCFIDQDDPTTQVTSFTGSSYRISRDAGATFVTNASFGGANRFINPTDYDNTLNILYGGFSVSNIIRIANVPGPGAVVANAFAVVTGVGAANFAVSAVKVDPTTADVVWFAFSTASGSGSQVPRLYKVTAASTATPGATQFVLPSGAGQFVAGTYISSIDIDPSNGSHMLMTLSNYGVTSVWECTDGGTTWNSVEGNLPDFPVRWGMFVPQGSNPGSGVNAIGGVMLATELGVWSTQSLTGGTTTWIQNSTGFGNVRTDMLRIRSADRTVAVGTHGRGVFTTQLFVSLPVDFTSFTGRAESTLNKLNWKVENEVNNSGYEIQRRYKNDGDFVKVGFVPAKAHQGANEYGFDDALVDLGKENTSYRLKQIDIDGRYTYSNVVSLQRKVSTKFVEYTAVSGNQLLIRMNAENGNQKLMLRLFDMEGRLLKQSAIAYKTQWIDISTLPRGGLIVDIQHADGRRYTKKFVY